MSMKFACITCTKAEASLHFHVDVPDVVPYVRTALEAQDWEVQTATIYSQTDAQACKIGCALGKCPEFILQSPKIADRAMMLMFHIDCLRTEPILRAAMAEVGWIDLSGTFFSSFSAHVTF